MHISNTGMCHLASRQKEPFGLLLTQTRAIYIRYVQFVKFLLKNEQLRPLLSKLSKEEGTGKNVRVPHMGSHVFNLSVEEKLMSITEADDFFTKNPMKNFLFTVCRFIRWRSSCSWP